MLQVVYKGTMLFRYTKSVSRGPRCYDDTTLTRPPAVVRFHPPYAQYVPVADPDPSPQLDSCRESVWEVMLYTTIVLVLAQITVALISSDFLRIEVNSCRG